MRIIVLGAGHVGMTIVEALFDDHEVTVVDVDPQRLTAVSDAFDVRTIEGNGASGSVLQEAGIEHADLLIASSSRDDANLLAASIARRLSAAKTLVRATDVEHLRAWRAGVLDVDFIVSSELEAARAVMSALSVPGARATDSFADGQVLIAEFDVEMTPQSCPLVGRPLARTRLPADSRVALIVRDGEIIAPKGDVEIRPADRVVVMGSPAAVHEWSQLLAPGEPAIESVLIFGAGRVGSAIARELLDHGKRVRIAEPDATAARRAAALLPGARVHHTAGVDREFLRQERLDRSDAAIAATGDDARSLYAAIAARARGVPFTVGIVDDPVSAEVFDAAGVDVAVNPRRATAEELIRFAHDPRTRQIAMLDDDRFDVIDILVRPDGELVGRPLRDLPRTGTTIGAIVRDGRAVFPRADERLRPGDRAIVVVDPARAVEVERAL